MAIVLAIIASTVACGSREAQEAPSTQQSTVSTPSSSVSTEIPETSDDHDDDGIVRSAMNVSGDGAGWVWDKISGTGSWIWDGISGAGGWMWDRVTGLPGDISDVFQRFWRWFRGTDIGERAADLVISVQEVVDAVRDFSFTGLLWKISKVILYVGVLAVVVILAIVIIKNWLLKLVPTLLLRVVREGTNDGSNRRKQPSTSRIETTDQSRTDEDLIRKHRYSEDGDPPKQTVNIYFGQRPPAEE